MTEEQLPVDPTSGNPDSHEHLWAMYHDFFGVGKAGAALVNKVSNAIGSLYRPAGTVLNAYASDKAANIKAKGLAERKAASSVAQWNLEDALESRTAKREKARLIKQQINFESALGDAAAQMTDDSKIDQLDDDFTARWVRQVEMVSDVEIRSLWAKLLAHEATAPGTFSHRLLDIIGGMGRREADIFLALCCFVDRDSKIAFVYDPSETYYTDHGLNYESLGDLTGLSLIDVNPLSWNMTCEPDDRDAGDEHYKFFDRQFLFGKPGSIPYIPVGAVRLTTYGKQLLELVDPFPEPASDIAAKVLAGMQRSFPGIRLLETQVITVPAAENRPANP